MIDKDIFESCVARAVLAPTIHNTQPARWRRDGEAVSLFCDTNTGLPAADPLGHGAALSCGAVLEGMILALSAHNISAKVTLTHQDMTPGQGLVSVAHLDLIEGCEDRLHTQLEDRFTWRGPFGADRLQLYGWTRADARLVMDEPNRAWIADRNDWASLEILRQRAFREELVGWMRLQDSHPRAGLDGMDRAALNMTARQARNASLALTTFWRVFDVIGTTKTITAERDVTLTAPVIALFHRDISEDMVESGRAYLRMCLEAANLGLAGWPMAALADHPSTNAQVCERFGLRSDRRLIQAVRFGRASGAQTPRARRPLSEVLG